VWVKILAFLLIGLVLFGLTYRVLFALILLRRVRAFLQERGWSLQENSLDPFASDAGRSSVYSVLCRDRLGHIQQIQLQVPLLRGIRLYSEPMEGLDD